MRILVLNQYFHPDVASTAQLLTELCEDLSREHQVTVVAGRPSYNPVAAGRSRGLVSEERHGSVRVLRTWSTSFPRGNILGRLANYATYLASCFAGAFRAGRPDVILTMTDPPVVAAVAMVVGAVRRVPFVYVNQDVFPEVALALGRLRNPLVVRGLGALNRLLRRRAARVVAIGRDMRDRLEALDTPATKIAVIPNWADGAALRPPSGPSALRRAQGWEDRFVVMHSGNVGLSQGLGTLLDAAELLRDREDVVVAVVGDGASREGLQRDAERRGLSNVVFLPYQPKAELSDSLGAADVHVVGLAPGLAGYIVPSKVYGIMAAGRPFVAAVEPASEAALLASEFDCGVAVAPGDGMALAEAILDLRERPDLAEMGARARAAFEERFDRPIAVAAYARLLSEVAAGGNSPRM